MSELGSMAELEGKKDTLEAETEQEIEEAEENREEAAEACDVLDNQPQPSIDDTKQGLNDICDGLASHVKDETERHQERVGEQVELEKSDLSEPVREGEGVENDAAGEIEGRAAGAGRYEGEMHDAAGTRSEAAELLGELGGASEEHQEQSTEEVERLSEEAKAAAEALRRY